MKLFTNFVEKKKKKLRSNIFMYFFPNIFESLSNVDSGDILPFTVTSQGERPAGGPD